MADRRKRVAIQYRKAAYPVGETRNWPLEQLLTEAVKHQEADGVSIGSSPKHRHYDLPGYGTLVLNAFDPNPTMGFFMELVRFEPGAELSLLEMDGSSSSYNLKQAKAPDGHEPFKGVLYLLARGNDVVLLEQDVSGLKAEQYISWLLSERTDVCGKNTRLILDATYNREGGQRLADVKLVRVKPQLLESDNLITRSPITVSDIECDDFTNRASRILLAAGMDEAAISELTAGQTNIEVTLQIRFKGERRFKTVPGPTLDRLLRNVDEEELTLDGPAGREQKGKIVKLAYGTDVATAGVFLSRRDVAQKLNEAYLYFRKHGHVSA